MTTNNANTILIIARYPKWLFFMGISFYKLMGSGRNGTFDKTPDWQQWAVLLVFVNNNIASIPLWMKKFYSICQTEVLQIKLKAIEGHGLWDGQQPFGQLQKQTDYNGTIAVLTRATIRLSQLKNFWENVDGVAKNMSTANGFITSFGIGEIPFIKQATFSIWQSKDAMKNFAYKMQEHTTVIQQTRKQNWYSEDMFVRFIPIEIEGTNQQKKINI
jgi:hypothetical protein